MFAVPELGKLRSKPYVLLEDGSTGPAGLAIQLQTSGEALRATLHNQTTLSYKVSEVCLFDFDITLPSSTAFYGEGYTMLSQSGGSLAEITDIGSYTDRGHYRLPEPAGMRTVYGMMTLSPEPDIHILIGFSSCKRFTGRFHLNASRLMISVGTEGLTLAPGEKWELEELLVMVHKNRADLLANFSKAISRHHPRLRWKTRPAGWCSWYWYWDSVTADDIQQNLKAIQKAMPKQLSYIQIDDGYEPWMGDWLEQNERFPGGISKLSLAISTKGFLPALWVAPFIASPQSKLFMEHPEWFVADETGQPLASDTKTFGGWRQAPWYMLDGTHPGAQNYLEHVFSVMNKQWGIRYFKLDANVWGAMPFGKRYDPKASSVQAHRQGMAAIRRGAGDSFILACNHAVWPTLGEAHGVRTSGDITRDWATFTVLARENLARSWQNDRLWWVDPDCVTLIGPEGCKATAEEFSYHICAAIATGGLLLSGDNTTLYTKQQWNLLKRLLDIPAHAAEFQTDGKLGWIHDEHADYALLLNTDEQPYKYSFDLSSPKVVHELIEDRTFGVNKTKFHIDIPAHSGRILRFQKI